MSTVTLDSKVEEAQELIDEIKASTKLDVEKRAKLIVLLQRSQFNALSQRLAVMKFITRMPENPPKGVSLLGLPLQLDSTGS